MALIILLLLALTSMLISIPAVQTWVVKRVTGSLTTQLGTSVTVESVHLGWTGNVSLGKILIKDERQDSLIFIDNLKFRLLRFDQNKRKVKLANVHLESPLVNFKHYEGEDHMNYQFLVDLSRQEGGGGVWTTLFKNLFIHNGEFRYRIEGFDPPTDRLFDENDFAFTGIEAELKDFYLIGDSLDLKIKHLKATERNGLELKRMVSKAKIHATGMEFADMRFKTADSDIKDYLAFSYSSYQSFQHFLDSVRVKTNLDKSVIAASDLAYFSFNLNPYKHNNITFSGSAHGYVSNFKLRDFDLEIGKSSVVKGDMDLRGLPDWQSSFIDLKISELRSHPAEVERVMALELQDKMKAFEAFTFTGHLTGFYSDFAADGRLNSALGQLNSRINFKLQGDDGARYMGQLVAQDFEVGRFLENNELGKTSFTFDLDEGSGLTFETLRTRFASKIDYIEYNGTRINNVEAKGLYTDQFFDGNAHLDDPSLKFTFDGKMNFKPVEPRFDFKANIQHVDLKALKIDTIATTASANVDIKLVGDDVDRINGYAKMSGLSVNRDGMLLELEQLDVQSEIGETQRALSIKSDYIDGSITGKYSLKNLGVVYQDFLHTLFPDFYDSVVLNEEIAAKANFIIRENDLIEYWTSHNIQLGNGKVNIEYNTTDESLESHSHFDRVKYDDYDLLSYDLIVRKRPHQLLNLSNDIKRLEQNGELLTNDILLNASILPNYAEYLLDFADTSDLIALRSFGALQFGSDSIQIQLEDSRLYLDGEAWEIAGSNSAVYHNSELFIERFTASNKGQLLHAHGLMTDRKTTEYLLINTQNLDLASFNPLLQPFELTLGGVSQDSIGVYQVFGRPVVHGNLKIKNLAVNGDTIGNFRIETYADENPLVMDVEASVEEGLFKNVSAKGRLDLSSGTGKLRMDIRAKDAEIKPIAAIFEGVASDFSGSIDGRIKVFGTFDEPAFTGHVQAKNVSFLVDYLNTRYTVNDRIGLSNTSMDFRGLRVNDVAGQTAEVNGQILHDFFDNITLNIAIENADQMQVLNTTKEDNELFYGKGIASGSARFTGPLDDIYIEVNASTNKGSNLTVPVYDNADNTLVDYIRFAQTVHTEEEEETTESDQKITMKMNVDITQDAEFVLLFDEVLDDKISGRGEGNVSMQYATGEDFFMYGVYTIQEGIYPFSSPTLVSEKFDLREGGQIVWNGDPYNAKINLQAAVSRNRAKPADLMAGIVQGASDYNDNIKMNVILNLQGDLFSPEITFDWEFPDQVSVTRLSEFNTLVKKVEADPDELNRQVFSLLTFGSFSPASDHGAGINTPATGDYRDIVSSSIGNFLSNQVNNWISEYDKNWEFGVDYLTASGISDQERAELIFSARRKLLNDRVELAVDYSAVNNSNIHPYTVDLVYKVKKDGSLKLKAYHKVANDPTLGDVSNVATTGVGFYFRQQFNRIRLRRNKIKPE